MFNMGADNHQLVQLQLLLDQAPHLYYLKFQTWSSVLTKTGSKNKKSTTSPSIGNMPPFTLQSPSVRFLDLRRIDRFGDQQYYSENQCLSFIHSLLAIQREYLIIAVEKQATIILNWADILNVESGTDLEFDTHDQPFTPHATGTVISTQIMDSTTRLFTFANPVDVNVNDYVVVSDAPKLTIRNFTVENNCARGILLETRNIDIELVD